MATHTGAQAEKIALLRALSTSRGRREQGRFAFEGATLLDEARRSNTDILEMFVTPAAYEATASIREIEASGTPVYLVDDRLARRISDVETPTGIVAVAATRWRPIGELLAGLLVVLADLADPGNVGTLLRSADAFAASGVAFGRLGVDPYHPKVVRGAMGAVFRVPLATVEPEELTAAAGAAGVPLAGLASGGDPLGATAFPVAWCLIVGHERHGLGRWEACCTTRLAIPMPGQAESLNAAVAGSIALYEAAKFGLSSACQ
jgi:RNA methyltransferase, TrmH family